MSDTEKLNEDADSGLLQPRLVRLLARFRKFASCRRDVAESWRERGEYGVAAKSDSAADFFTRCADELERTINGEMPADPGHDWPPTRCPHCQSGPL